MATLPVIQYNISLKPYNTFGVDATAEKFCSIKNEEELQALLEDGSVSDKIFILGGGSNVLFTKDFDGLVARIDIRGIQEVGTEDNHVLIQVGAGEPWHPFVLHCISKDWGGVENLSLIPGNIGAAPVQNIGAYGVEIGNIISSVRAFDRSVKSFVTIHQKDCNFGYRDSLFKQIPDRYVVASVTLKLSTSSHHLVTTYQALRDELAKNNSSEPTIKSVSDAVIAIRRRKLPDPKTLGNAGSFFKNAVLDANAGKIFIKENPDAPAQQMPDGAVKIPSAWLIEQCGWKGKRFGPVGVHEQQALVIVNYGGGDGAMIKALATKIQASVNEKFGVKLQPEVIIL